jgi:hypothetical protein
VVAEEEQLEPYVKADQLLAPSQKEWRVKPPKEEFFSCPLLQFVYEFLRYLIFKPEGKDAIIDIHCCR